MTAKLILSNKNYRAEIMEYQDEFIKNNDSMDGTSGLASAKTVSKEFVPATSYLAISTDDEHLIGMILYSITVDTSVIVLGNLKEKKDMQQKC